MDIRIERAVEDDVKKIKLLEEDLNLSPWTTRDYVDEIKRIDSLFLVLRLDAEIIGFILARLTMITHPPNQSFNENEAEIYNIGIDRKFRERKFGTLLIEKLEEICTEKNISQIYLEVRKLNTIAQNFYRKNNFSESGIRKKFYTNPTDDAILFQLKIKSQKNTVT